MVLGLNDSGVESVEVIKGPTSLLYGSDALGGVLYFNPKNLLMQIPLKKLQSKIFLEYRW
jgi:outer membrane receptor protein involved in Fe transport